MKKILALGFLFFVLLNLQAGNAELFSYNKEIIRLEFQELSTLEACVKESGKSIAEIKVDANNLSYQLSATLLNDIIQATEKPLGIPAFWWGFGGACIGTSFAYGCWLGPVAILVVYLITEDKKEAANALWGCLAGGVAGVLVYILIFAVFLGSSFLPYYIQ